MLRLDVRFSRGAFQLRADVDVPIGVTGIFGPSGCGKSTLLAVVAGLLQPQRGCITFEGETFFDASTGVNLPAWRRHVALVFQDGQLFPHLSVRQNLLYGHARRDPAARRFKLDDAIDLLGIGSLLERRPAQLSGGERQRVALGRALLYSPRLLLLDEPLAALDEALKAQILPYLVRLKREAGLPMLYVTHSRAELDAVADRVMTMTSGCLDGQSLSDTGSPQALNAARPANSMHGENHVRGVE